MLVLGRGARPDLYISAASQGNLRRLYYDALREGTATVAKCVACDCFQCANRVGATSKRWRLVIVVAVPSLLAGDAEIEHVKHTTLVELNGIDPAVVEGLGAL